jgi:hypothetical protein
MYRTYRTFGQLCLSFYTELFDTLYLLVITFAFAINSGYSSLVFRYFAGPTVMTAIQSLDHDQAIVWAGKKVVGASSF